MPHYELWGLSFDGSTLWRFGGPDGAAGTNDPFASGDTVFTASALGWASAVNATTGEAFWSVDLEEALFEPIVASGLVMYGTRGFFGSDDRSGPLGAGHVIALDRDSGAEAWRFPLPDSAGYPLSGGTVSSGVVWRDLLIVGGRSAWVYALKISDGSLAWKRPNGGAPPTAGYVTGPVLAGDVVVFARPNNLMEGWEALSGVRLWQWDVPTAVSKPGAAGEYVYSFDGPLVVGHASGEILWEYGGLSNLSGTSFMRGAVSPDGLVYALGTRQSPGGSVALAFAIDPPVGPGR